MASLRSISVCLHQPALAVGLPTMAVTTVMAARLRVLHAEKAARLVRYVSKRGEAAPFADYMQQITMFTACGIGPASCGALAMFTRLSTDSLAVLAISAAQYRTAARLADQYTLGLRAGDALHLAVCADDGATLYTLDKRLGEACPLLDIKTTLL
jgi:predicted nucleic acid-binding protein